MTRDRRPAASAAGLEAVPLVGLAEQAVAGGGGTGGGGEWVVRRGPMWCVVAPVGRPPRGQGWKLHLSATPASAPGVLRAALPVLVAAGCAFKFAATVEQVRWLTSRSCPREVAGKFVTAYPHGDDLFRRLARDLDAACAGLVGPEILSDRRYRAGSVVHYRFGAFGGLTLVDDDGCTRPAVVGPGGEVVEDRRAAWYSPPTWAHPVLPGSVPGARPRAVAARPVLVGGRFVVAEAVAHSTRGGVFGGRDARTGREVVLKQARAYIEVDRIGRDCRDRLREEAALLARLAPTGLVPAVVDLVEHGDHLFLAQERVAGVTLRTWVARRAGGVPAGEGMALAGVLVGAVAAAHRAGLVLGDVSPSNVLVTPEGSVRLVDLEHAAPVGEPVCPAGTPGYAPPEHDRHAGPVAASPRTDLFGLGALLFLLAVGTDPVLAGETPPGRPDAARLRGWLLAAARDLPLARRIAPVALGLLRADPAARWSTAQARWYLDRQRDRRPVRPAPANPSRRYGHAGPDVERLIGDGVAHLLATRSPGGDRLWPTTRFGERTDPCAVQHGAAGVLAALVLAASHLPDPEPVRAAVAATCRWIEERLPAAPRVLPGLHFGRSGVAWALHAAAGLLGDPDLAARAVEWAVAIPADWPNPDVAHGAAGAGMAALHLWRASGDDRLRERVRACADDLVDTARHSAGTVSWPVPAGLRSTLAGRTFHGFAHGTAGVGTFLLAAGSSTGDAGYLELAGEAAATLASAARRRAGAAWWPAGPAAAGAGSTVETGSGGDAGWCKGAAGIGEFLLRAAQVTGQDRYLELARAAAAAVHRSRWASDLSACHGLAGGGHLLLDLADALGEPAYRAHATDLARTAWARRTRRDGRWVVPDETGRHLAADHGSGLAGTLTFLIRLRYGGPRPWTVRP